MNIFDEYFWRTLFFNLIYVKDILSEEQRRKEARDKCSLFVAGIPKKTKAQDLKSLHPDIIAVRHMSSQKY